MQHLYSTWIFDIYRSRDSEGADSFSRSPSPADSEEQWEVESILDYAKDGISGDLYYVKWKNWESEFNTWEPKSNLQNCDSLLLDFYRERKAAANEVLLQSTYVVTSAGKRRRKGPALIAVPPDPRSVEDRICEFFYATVPVADEELQVGYCKVYWRF